MVTTCCDGKRNDKMESLAKEIECLKKRLDDERCKLNDVKLPNIAKRLEEIDYLYIKTRRILKGHQSKVLCSSWAPDKRHIISSSQDGRMILWEGFQNNKEMVIYTPIPWVMACVFAPSANFIAYGGMDNKVTVYPITVEEDAIRKKKTAGTHTSFMATCLYPNSDQQILTGSGDKTCALWDVETGQLIQSFAGHFNDVKSIDLTPAQNSGRIFASGSSDKTMLLWDMRVLHYVQKFEGDRSDVNGVKFHPSGDSVAMASDDATCRLFDIRADKQLSVYRKESVLLAANSIDFSVSGRLLIAGYDDSMINVWDTLKCCRINLLPGHEGKISSVKVSPDGTAFLTSSWDNTIRIWA